MPRIARSSSTRRGPCAWTAASAVRARWGSRSSTSSAPEAWTTISPTACAIASWVSCAIRWRSRATATRSLSSRSRASRVVSSRSRAAWSAVPAHAATRQPRDAQQQHEERVVLAVAPDRVQRRQPGGRGEHGGQRPAQRRMGADGYDAARTRNTSAFACLPPGRPERPVERRRHDRDARERRDRQPAAQRQRERGERGERRAVRRPARRARPRARRRAAAPPPGRCRLDALERHCPPVLPCAGRMAATVPPRRAAVIVRSQPPISQRYEHGSAPRRIGIDTSADGARARVHSVADHVQPITHKRLGVLLAGVAVVNALVFSPLGDEWFFAIVLLGPIAHGIAVGVRHGDTRLAAATWAACGLFWLVLDWIINREDVAFHAVLALVMAGLVALGAGSSAPPGGATRPRGHARRDPDPEASTSDADCGPRAARHHTTMKQTQGCRREHHRRPGARRAGSPHRCPPGHRLRTSVDALVGHVALTSHDPRSEGPRSQVRPVALRVVGQGISSLRRCLHGATRTRRQRGTTSDR